MSTDTDIRLRSKLDANQRDREQMCRSVLALDPHYSEVRPRHPLGGPDGARDIEATFDGRSEAYAAVGFINSANDSEDQKRKIRAKYSSDLRAALAAKPDLKVFAFLTNLHLTAGDKSEMKEEATSAGIEHCDVLDRERLRIELDSPAGFFIRFQYLDIPLSEAEQASFLAHYGDRIQQVVSTGFERVEKTLDRVLFLQEAAGVLDAIYVRFHLTRSFPASEIGHFRAFMGIALRAVKHNIVSIWFGSADKQTRFRRDASDSELERPGIGAGIGSGAWESHVQLPKDGNIEDPTDSGDSAPSRNGGDGAKRLMQVGGGSSIGVDPVRGIFISYGHDDPLIRLRPRLELRDLDECMFVCAMNKSLAEKIQSIEVFANGYKLAHVGPDDFKVDHAPYEPSIPAEFSAAELQDPWVRIRPSAVSSAFHLHFNEATPRRMFGHAKIIDPKASEAEAGGVARSD